MEESLIYPLPGRAWLDVSVMALRHNAAVLQEKMGVPLIPMVKANAYGVGAAGVVAALEPLDPVAYGVATVREGQELREIGVTRPIIVFTPLLPSDHSRARTAGLTLALGDADSIRSWASTGGSYHLSIETGMNRAGVAWYDIASVRDVVSQWPPAGAFTHYHSAETSPQSAIQQAERFIAAVRELGTPIAFLHADNSASSAGEGTFPVRWSAIRPGIFLYGVGRNLGLVPQPVVSLRARIVSVRWIEAGETVSYDATFRADRRSRIATAAVGYGDGYPRSLSNRAVGMINGNRVPQLGLVTMDMTMFDVTDAECAIGDVVTVIGAGSGNDLTVEAIAALAAMSPYELLTGLADRLDRRFNA